MKKSLIALLCAAFVIAATGCAGGQSKGGADPEAESKASEQAVIDVPVVSVTGDPSKSNPFTDDQLVTWAGSYYEFCRGEKAPNVEVDHVEGDTVYIVDFEDIKANEAEGEPGHRTVLEWYIVDRNTGCGKNFAGEDVDLTTFLRRTGDSGEA